MKRDSLITTDLIKEVLASVYAECRNPKLVHYEIAVAKLKCQKLGLEPETYSHRQVHTSVWRSMNELIECGLVVKEGPYYYGIKEYDDYCGKYDFKKYVYPANDDFEFISENTVAVKLEEVGDHDLINKAVSQKFGESKVYASYIYDNVLVIIFHRNALDDACVRELSAAISEARMYHLIYNEKDIINYFRGGKNK